MNTNSIRFRTFVSNWLLISFALILGISALITEVFQSNNSKNKVISLYENPIRSDILANLKIIVIKNRLGNFTLSKEKNTWMLKEPRLMPAKAAIVEKIVDALSSINVQNIHQYEPINLSSFSLDRPTLKINLYSELHEQVTINFGLFNPINDSTYLTVSNIKSIFQTGALTSKLDAIGLSELIDSNIFHIGVKDISSFKLYRGNKVELLHHFALTEEGFTHNRYKVIENEATEKSLKKIMELKPHLILDEMAEETKTTVQNYLDNPLYILEIVTKDEETISFTISNLIRPLPDIKMEAKQNFLISASDQKYVFLLEKDQLNLFNIKYQDLR